MKAMLLPEEELANDENLYLRAPIQFVFLGDKNQDCSKSEH